MKGRERGGRLKGKEKHVEKQKGRRGTEEKEQKGERKEVGERKSEGRKGAEGRRKK